jgi:lipopolysaccharide biosynthesis glycosyltransferase
MATLSGGDRTSIHVACALDERMLLAGRALARSIARHAQAGRPVVLHVLHANLESGLLDVLAGLEHGGFSCRLHDVGDAFSGLPIGPPFSTAIYYRLNLPSLLADLTKVIYLDADTIVLRDLAGLYDLPVDDVALAAMPDHALYYFELMSAIPVGESRKPTISYMGQILGLNYRGPESYFNSGVMLLNLDIWRARDIAAQCIAFIKRFSYLQWPNQDALNVVCGQRYLALDARWNVFAMWCEAPSRFGPVDSLVALQKDWVEDPWIVHFSGNCKPWKTDHRRTVHDRLFWQHLDPGIGEPGQRSAHSG